MNRLLISWLKSINMNTTDVFNKGFLDGSCAENLTESDFERSIVPKNNKRKISDNFDGSPSAKKRSFSIEFKIRCI